MIEPANLSAVGGELAAESARLASLGWMRATSGNLSVVLSREPLRLAVTASGKDKGELSPDDVVVVDGGGIPLPGQALRPSSEAALHAVVAAWPDVGAVVHVHLRAAVMAARHWPDGVALEGLEMLKALGRRASGDVVRIPVVENDQDMEVLGDRFKASVDHEVPAVIVAGHGLYAWGPSLREARHHTEAIAWLLELVLAVR